MVARRRHETVRGLQLAVAPREEHSAPQNQKEDSENDAFLETKHRSHLLTANVKSMLRLDPIQ